MFSQSVLSLALPSSLVCYVVVSFAANLNVNSKSHCLKICLVNELFFTSASGRRCCRAAMSLAEYTMIGDRYRLLSTGQLNRNTCDVAPPVRRFQQFRQPRPDKKVKRGLIRRRTAQFFPGLVVLGGFWSVLLAQAGLS